jgi:hypothetical protein
MAIDNELLVKFAQQIESSYGVTVLRADMAKKIGVDNLPVLLNGVIDEGTEIAPLFLGLFNDNSNMLTIENVGKTAIKINAVAAQAEDASAIVSDLATAKQIIVDGKK